MELSCCNLLHTLTSNDHLAVLTPFNQDENLRDVLYFVVGLMADHPATMVPAFDRRQGAHCVFKLLASEDELTRIQSLKLLGYYLKYSKHK
ncbi:unnamed protein product [Protopolystoma xenopodis]|uniref:DUF4704 domain-containing protein n=1 Tax=Protopolystoma xenopodis TaxID=117903 RepID=A0A3S5AHB1_9PLAT|nr:unnamed protein product [Protopolystoma xenopodis]